MTGRLRLPLGPGVYRLIATLITTRIQRRADAGEVDQRLPRHTGHFPAVSEAIRDDARQTGTAESASPVDRLAAGGSPAATGGVARRSETRAPAGVEALGGTEFDRVPGFARVHQVLTHHGADAYAVDRDLAIALERGTPGLGRALCAAESFRRRAIRAAGRRGGVGQLVVVGMSYPRPADPALPDLHLLAHAHLGGRTLYLDSDPVLLAHGRAGYRGAGARVVDADPIDADAVLAALAEAGLRDRPSVVCAGPFLLERMTDAARFTSALLTTLPVGSLLILTHLAADLEPAAHAAARQFAGSGLAVTPRTRAQVTALLAGTRLLGPGLTRPHRWHDASTTPARRRLEDQPPATTTLGLFHAALAEKTDR
ncbi:SAM-dependent methyltransferase [Nocardia takedensis]|uniref:SAM-dependent methyltransferase n=1 Tax=Nocardia takedensis TaxID=259390 RepID=UPI003F765EC0